MGAVLFCTEIAVPVAPTYALLKSSCAARTRVCNNQHNFLVRKYQSPLWLPLKGLLRVG